MSDTLIGKVQTVETDVIGDNLSGDHVLGAASILLNDVIDFNEKGGQLTINGDLYVYSNWNDDTRILSVAPPLVANYDDDTPVFLDPASSQKLAHVQVFESGEVIRAVVTQSLTDAIPLGPRNTLTSETVVCDNVMGYWEITRVAGVELVRDGSYIAPSTLPPAVTSDGSPPSTSPATTVEAFSVGAVKASWTPIINPDPSTFDVYASLTSPVTLASTYVGSTSGTSAVISKIAGVQIPLDGTPIYVAVLQRDNDGPATSGIGAEGSAAAAQADNVFISASYAYLGAIQALQIESGTLDAALIVGDEIATAEEGNDRVGFNRDGFFSEDALGVRSVDIPNFGSPMFRGNLQADAATFINGFEARGHAVIATGGQLDLASSQSDPGTAPTAWQWHELVPLATATKPAAGTYPEPILSTHSGTTEPVWDAANNRWLIAALWKISSASYRLYIYQDVSPFGDGTWVGTDATYSTATDWSFMHAFIHGTRLVVGMVAAGAGGNWFPAGFLLSNLAVRETWNGATGTPLTNTSGMTVGSDGTDLIFAKIAPTTATHEGVAMVANDMYAHRRPVTINAGNLTTGFVLGSIAQSWDMNQVVNPAANGTRKLKSVLTARSGSTVTFDYSSVVAFKSLTSNVATIETVDPHSFDVGHTVTIAGVDATFNGTYVITAETAYSFSYAKVAANVTRIAAAGSVVWAGEHVMIVTGDQTGIGGFNITNCVFTCTDSAGPTNAVFRGGWYGTSHGMAWNSTDGYLWAYDAPNFRLEKQHHNKQGGYWNISYTYTDDNATGGRHESLRSPEFRMGGWARSKTTFQSGSIPIAGGTDDPNGVRFYIRHDSAPNTPARSWRIGTGNGFVAATPGSSAAITLDDVFPLNADAPAYNVDTGLTRAPTTNSYPIGTAGKLVSLGDASGRGAFYLNGLGLAEIPGLILPRYKKGQSAAQTLTTGVTTTILFGATASPDDGSWSYSAGVFTCIKPGSYLVIVGVSFVGNATGNRHTTVTKNSSADPFSGQGGSSINAIQFFQTCMGFESFAVGDTITVNSRQQSGGNLNTVVGNGTFVNLIRLGF